MGTYKLLFLHNKYIKAHLSVSLVLKQGECCLKVDVKLLYDGQDVSKR